MGRGVEKMVAQSRSFQRSSSVHGRFHAKGSGGRVVALEDSGRQVVLVGTSGGEHCSRLETVGTERKRYIVSSVRMVKMEGELSLGDFIGSQMCGSESSISMKWYGKGNYLGAIIF